LVANAVAQAVAVACNTFEVYAVVSALLFWFLLDAVSNHSSSNNDTPGSRSDDGYNAARSVAVTLLILYAVLALLAWITTLVACIGSSLAAHDSRRAHKLKAEPEPTTEHETAVLQDHWQKLQQAQPGIVTAQLA
jgi:hypothetical protein